MGHLCLHWYNRNYSAILITASNLLIGYSRDINLEHVSGYPNGTALVTLLLLDCAVRNCDKCIVK